MAANVGNKLELTSVYKSCYPFLMLDHSSKVWIYFSSALIGSCYRLPGQITVIYKWCYLNKYFKLRGILSNCFYTHLHNERFKEGVRVNFLDTAFSRRGTWCDPYLSKKPFSPPPPSVLRQLLFPRIPILMQNTFHYVFAHAEWTFYQKYVI